MNNDKLTIEISGRAMRGMQYDLSLWPGVETGGVLLGYVTPQMVRVFEATDGGYENAVRKQGCFSYDHHYVTHISSYVANLYQPPLNIIGFWHKHNHDYDPCLSDEDLEMQERLFETNNFRGCSILFQKKSGPEDIYSMRVFITEKGKKYCEVRQSDVLIRPTEEK